MCNACSSSRPHQRSIKIAAVTRKPHSPSFAERVTGYIRLLGEMNIEIVPLTLPKGLIKQYRFFSQLDQYDAVWWHRHLLKFPHVNRLSQKAKKLVFDFDDPVIFSSKNSDHLSKSRQFAFKQLLKHCTAALPASQYLKALSEHYCPSTIHPMAIDLPQNTTTQRNNNDAIELLWLGSRSTQIYMEPIRPVLEKLGQSQYPIKLRLVAHEPMTFGKMEVDFRKWSHEEQDAALRQCHIGLCPMPDNFWTRGKCPFKVIQYMSYGMPWVGSKVGENVTSAGKPQHAPRGLCASDHQQWEDSIKQLAADEQCRTQMGKDGLSYVSKHHDRQKLAIQLAEFWHQTVTN